MTKPKLTTIAIIIQFVIICGLGYLSGFEIQRRVADYGVKLKIQQVAIMQGQIEEFKALMPVSPKAVEVIYQDALSRALTLPIQGKVK